MKGTFLRTKTKCGKSLRRLEKEDINALTPRLLRFVLIGTAMFCLFFLAIPSSAGAFPPSPPDVVGEVYYTDGTPVVGASVTLNNTRTGDEVQTKTTDDGTWCINMKTTIHARNGDKILVTVFAPNSVEKKKSEILTVNTSELVQEMNFVFEKESEAPGGGGGSSNGGGSASNESSAGETRTNATAAEEEKGAENISEQQQQPSPSEVEERENATGEGGSENPAKEGDEKEEGKGKSIPGFQFLCAGLAGLIAIAVLFIFIIKKFR